ENSARKVSPPSTYIDIMADSDLIFFVNGKKNTLPKPDPEVTLLQYLRSD
ncbi:hypothetical protein BaRGS_00003329, partial [Batillaria attramentaria]